MKTTLLFSELKKSQISVTANLRKQNQTLEEYEVFLKTL